MSEKKKLVIVESPSKASTIKKYLGEDDFDVVASNGHICDLSTKGKGGLGIDVENDFKADYVISTEKRPVVKQLKEKVKKSDFVYLATDPDREGEAIAYHLANNLGISLTDNNRIVFHEVTKPAVTQAISQPRTVDMDLVNSQETRRILDRIIGFKLSTLLKSKIKSRSAGRVQSVALKLIVDREKEINAFVPVEYWTINSEFNKDKIDFIADLTKIAGKKAEIKDEHDASEIKEYCQSHDFVVKNVKEEQKTRKPKFPYITSTLQQDSANKLFFTSKKTMRIAQGLYEGKDVGKGLTGLITYMRTDSNRLSEVFVNQASEYIKNTYGDKYVGKYHDKVDKNAQDAHEAIRPTDINNEPEKIKDHLTNDEYKLYKLIYYRTLACLMSECKYTSTTISINCGQYEYTSNGKLITFDGYLKVYKEYETSEENLLPTLEVDEVLKPININTKQHFTEPPLRYSEARLIKAMEENGIGRPSTYATIIDTIIQRDYVQLQKSGEASKVKVFVPTEQGILTTDKLDEFFNSIINVKYTSNMESELDEIAAGKMEKVQALNLFYKPFMDLLENAKANMIKIEPEEVGRECPECGGKLVIRKGRYGNFIACSNYPKCTYKENVENETNDNGEPIDYGTCPECGHPLVKKKSRFGSDFIGCSNYPNCHYIKKKEQPAPVETGLMCPECGHPLVKKLSRYGKEFIGCSNYPNCHYIQKSENARTKKKK